MGEDVKVNKDTQKLVGNLLRWGVMVSMTVALLGGVVYIYRHGAERPDYSAFKISDISYSSIDQIINGVFNFKGRAIILLGILLLIFTPVFRIVLAIISFFIEKDYLYVAIGLLVLSIIAMSLLGGFTH